MARRQAVKFALTVPAFASVGQVAAALPVLARMFRPHGIVHVEIGKAEKDDVRAFIEPDFDERIILWHGRHDRVHAPRLADPVTVHVCEVRWLRPFV
jgi:hypothetical protein